MYNGKINCSSYYTKISNERLPPHYSYVPFTSFRLTFIILQHKSQRDRKGDKSTRTHTENWKQDEKIKFIKEKICSCLNAFSLMLY